MKLVAARATLISCFALVLLLFAGCSSDDVLKDVVVHDTLDRLQRSEGFEFDASLSGGGRRASLIHCRERTSISAIMWTGVLDTVLSEGADLIDDQAYFNLRIYERGHSESVVGPLVFSKRVRADVQIAPGYIGQGGGTSREIYAFTMSYAAGALFELGPGDYWIEISDGGTFSHFLWAVERGKVNSPEGCGGAAYMGPEYGWGSAVEGVDAFAARGYSLLLEGQTID